MIARELIWLRELLMSELAKTRQGENAAIGDSIKSLGIIIIFYPR